MAVSVGGELALLKLLGVVLGQPDDPQRRGREDGDAARPERSAEQAGDERRQHEHEQLADDPAAVPERLHARSVTASGGLRAGALADAKRGVDDLLVELAAAAGEQLPASLGVREGGPVGTVGQHRRPRVCDG